VIRWTVAGLIVVGLLVGIWLVWPQDGSAVTTVPGAAETTTTQVTTTTTAASTTTTLDPLQVRDVETVEQAEAILRELWFGWFEGIYNQDEDRIREVVATEEQVEEARDAFGEMEFNEPPSREGFSFSNTEIFRSDEACLAVWSEVSADFREGSSEGVHLLRKGPEGWLMFSYWRLREDLWEDDCEATLD
jgi:hypothetical protein